MKTFKTIFILSSAIFFNFTISARNQGFPAKFSTIKVDESGIVFNAFFSNLQNESENVLCLIALPHGCDSVNINVKKIGFGESYVSSGLLSKQFIRRSKIEFIRGYRILSIDFNPFFRFLSKKNHITNLIIKVDFVTKKATQEDNKLYSEGWENLVKSLVINPTHVPGYRKHFPVKEEDGAEYLIIAPDDFLPSLEPLKTFRIRQGISTKLVGTSITGSSSSSIKNYIAQAYNTWNIPPTSVLLAADHPLIPAPVWNSYCSSDNLYADVNYDDLPDIFVGRIPVTSNAQLETFISKIILFEANPINDPAYYLHPLACTGFENPSINSWMVTEILNGWYEHKMSKMPERQYTGTNPAPAEWPNPELYAIFGPDGLGYLSENPGYLSNHVGGSATGINQALNQGAMTFFSFSNGNATSFDSPSYTISDLAGLENTPPALFISMNSLTGNFASGNDCLAEAFLKNDNGGIGAIAPSEVMYLSGSEWFTVGLIDGLWDNFYPGFSNLFQTDLSIPCQANNYAKYFLYINNFPVNPQIKMTFYHLFHYFGEPYTTIHDSVPLEISVTHSNQLIPGQDLFEVTADSGATVALVLNDQICNVQKSMGSPMLLPITNPEAGDTLHITAIQRNRIRYYSAIVCTSAVGFNDPVIDLQFTITPNPASNMVFINFQGNLETSKIELLSTMGEVIFSIDFQQYSEIKIPVSGLAQGVYFVKVTNIQKAFLIKKLVIQ